MKLQILVPQYNEDTETVAGLLDSLATQRGINFSDLSVIIMNDGSDTKIDMSDTEYPFPVVYISDEKHRGISGTRNALMDMADADYVMFCDADDCFFSSLGLLSIFEQMDDGFDALISRFIEETQDAYIDHEKDGTFVHGKVYRRLFLLENGIRFDETINRNEDFSFNAAAQALAGKILYVDTPFYLWCYNPSSVTRSTESYMCETFDQFLIAFEHLIDDMLRRGKNDYAVRFFAIMHSKAKTFMFSDMWLSNETEAQDRAEKIFDRLCEKYETLYLASPRS